LPQSGNNASFIFLGQQHHLREMSGGAGTNATVHAVIWMLPAAMSLESDRKIADNAGNPQSYPGIPRVPAPVARRGRAAFWFLCGASKA